MRLQAAWRGKAVREWAKAAFAVAGVDSLM